MKKQTSRNFSSLSAEAVIEVTTEGSSTKRQNVDWVVGTTQHIPKLVLSPLWSPCQLRASVAVMFFHPFDVPVVSEFSSPRISALQVPHKQSTKRTHNMRLESTQGHYHELLEVWT